MGDDDGFNHKNDEENAVKIVNFLQNHEATEKESKPSLLTLSLTMAVTFLTLVLALSCLRKKTSATKVLTNDNS